MSAVLALFFRVSQFHNLETETTIYKCLERQVSYIFRQLYP